MEREMRGLYWYWLVGVMVWGVRDGTGFQRGYLKFCSERDKQSIESGRCLKGLWLETPLHGCVCAKGVWALSGGLCDKKAAIIVGENHCFHIDFPVRSVKFIGDPLDPFAPSVHTASDDLDVIHRVTAKDFSPTLSPDSSSIVIGINALSETVESADGTNCLQLDPVDRHKPVHIYSNPARSPRDGWKVVDRCPAPFSLTYSKHIGYGEMYQGSTILSHDFIGRNCLEKCPSSPLDPTSAYFANKPRRGRTFSAHRKREGIPPDNSSSSSSSSMGGAVGSSGHPIPLPIFVNGRSALSPPPSPPSSPQRKAGRTMGSEGREFRAKVRIDMDDYHREVNEQTLRMMHAHLGPLLLTPNRTTQKLFTFTKEYLYFQKARRVVKHVCPEEYVPDGLVDGLMRMFRRLLWESLDQSGRAQEEKGDSVQFARINTILDNCTDFMDPFEFRNYTGAFNFSGFHDATDPDWPKQEQCPEPLIYASNGTDIDGVPKMLLNASSSFKPWLKFNVSLVDYVVETAWKIVTIAHYQCSKSFSGLTAEDFSTFFHQVELLFNDKIIKRWYDPVNVKGVYKIVEMIFPAYDLKKAAFGLDLCLFSAQQFSHFGRNSKWIQRPKIPYTANDLDQQKYIIPGLGNRLSTNDYAPKAQDYLPPPSRRRRRQLPTTSLWDGKGECMNSFADPMTRFGYKAKAGCHRTNKGKLLI